MRLSKGRLSKIRKTRTQSRRKMKGGYRHNGKKNNKRNQKNNSKRNSRGIKRRAYNIRKKTMRNNKKGGAKTYKKLKELNTAYVELAAIPKETYSTEKQLKILSETKLTHGKDDAMKKGFNVVLSHIDELLEKVKRDPY